jgi:PEGA domain
MTHDMCHRLSGSGFTPLRRPRRRHPRFWSVPPWLAAAVAVTVAAGMAAAACWIATGGKLEEIPLPIALGAQQASAAGPPDGVSVRIDSVPTSAEVRIDGTRRGATPAQLSLSPGTHTVSVHQTGSMDLVRSLKIPAAGTSMSVQAVAPRAQRGSFAKRLPRCQPDRRSIPSGRHARARGSERGWSEPQPGQRD